MTNGNLVPSNTHSTSTNQYKFDKNTYPHHLMNEGSQVQTNMTPINEEMEDEEMTEVAMPMAGMNPTRTSARLAEKLKKLMQSTDTNGNKDDMMEINEEEQRKQTHAIQLPVDLTKETPNSPSAAPSPGIKKFRNDKTPTSHAKAKPFSTFHQQAHKINRCSTQLRSQQHPCQRSQGPSSRLRLCWRALPSPPRQQGKHQQEQSKSKTHSTHHPLLQDSRGTRGSGTKRADSY